MSLFSLLQELSRLLWALPMPLLLLGTHLYFTCRLGLIQRRIPRGIALSLRSSPRDSSAKGVKKTPQVSPYGALSTALAATIGTGNIIGISTAIAIGGPGAVFWCWLTGLLGIATCYGECLLALLYRITPGSGKYLGGPMYVLENRLHRPGLAKIFSLAAVLASLGMGSSVQSHSICTAVTSLAPVSPHFIGIVAAVLAGFVMLGGIQGISKLCSFLVPFMSGCYLLGCFWLLFLNRDYLGSALSWILADAFQLSSLFGGVLGGGLLLCIRTGISRGLFTNEAGLGSIPMAAASAETSSPVEQSLISMTGPFWDTVVICAITGLTIVSSMLRDPGAFMDALPDALCFISFSQLPFAGTQLLSLSLILFAFATILGWCHYGECSINYLAGSKAKKPYQVMYLLFIYLGAVLSLDLVWGISDLLNALMALPNLLCLWLLRKEILQTAKNQ